MSEFIPAVHLAEKHEGGYTPGLPGDPGGETNFGISKRQYPCLDIKNLTIDQATEIYREDYWDRYHIGNIANQHIADFVFDLLINMGPRHDFMIVQRACNALGAGLEVDGIAGPRTLEAVNSADPDQLKQQIAIYAKAYYRSLTGEKQFLKAWLNRVADDEANA